MVILEQEVVEPGAAARTKLEREFGVRTIASADSSLADASRVVWAVKPQLFDEAAAPCAPHVGEALHLSVMAGIRSDRIAAALASERIVRAMPNMPALIGQGIAGLYARPSIDVGERAQVEELLAPTGELLWVAHEPDLDAVTALSGSGPAYTFYVAEAMVAAAIEMGLTADQGRRLALLTLAGSAALAAGSDEPLAALRERVTSRGGTTHAAVACLDEHAVKAAFVDAILAARDRARALGDELDG